MPLPAIPPWSRRARLGVLAGLGWGVWAQPQPLPTLPGTKVLQGWVTPDFIHPLRPRSAEGDVPKERIPFRWRGEQVFESYQGEHFQERPERFSLRRGAIEGQDVLLVADELTYRFDTGEVEALGNIRLEAPGLRLRCGRLRMNWNQQVGEAYVLELEVPPEWTLSAQKVQFSTLKHWEFKDVLVNGCPQAQPGWTVRVAELKVDLGAFATLRNAWVWLGKIPTPYFLPWAIYPAKAERSSGILAPSVWHSSEHGLMLGLPYFQTLGKRADLTLTPQYFSRQGFLWGAEARWNPDPTHQGSITRQWIRQRQDGRSRFRGSLKEVWQREDGWQINADLNQASDAFLESDYGQGIGGLGTTSFDSSIYVGRSFSMASLSFTAGRQRTFFLADDPLYREDFPTNFQREALPSAQVRFYPIAWGGLYLDGSLRTDRLTYRIQLGDDLPSGHYTWGRDDAYLRLQGRLGQWGPLRADLQMLGRYSRYAASLPDPFFETPTGTGTLMDNPLISPFRVDGPGLKRLLGSGRLQLSGSQYGRVFERFELFGWKGEVKHVMEPYLAMTANSRYGKAGRIPRFDEVDSRPGVLGTAMGEQSVEFGFRQHFFSRPGKGESFTDLVRWRTSIRYHVLPILMSDGRTQQKGWGSVDNELDVEPDDRVRISFRRSSDVGENGTDSSLSADVNLREGSSFRLAVFNAGINRLLVRQQGITVGGSQDFFEDRLRLEFHANYVFGRRGSTMGRKGGFATSQVALAYVTPCLATTLRFSHVALQIPGSLGKEDRLDLSLSLRGLGGLGDLFKIRF